MTRAEFDKWIGRNRRKAIRVAWKVVGKLDAEDAVQDAIAGVLASGNYRTCDLSKNPMAWFANRVRGYAGNRRRSRNRDQAFRAGLSHLLAAGYIRHGSSKKPSLSQIESGTWTQIERKAGR